MDRNRELGETNVLKLLVKFSIPAIVGMVVNALYNVVDRIFVGQGVNSTAIAGITASMPMFNIIMAFGMLFGLGGASLISIRLGQQNHKDAETVLGNGFLILAATGLMITFVGLIFLEPLLHLFGARGDVLPYARDYLSIILYGAVFQYVSFGLNHYIRAEGNPKIAMLSMMIGAVMNIVLDPIFIFVFNMGIKGAAIATIISQAASMTWVVSYFLRGKSILRFRRENFKINWIVTRRMVAIGSAPFAMQMAASLLNIILNNSLYSYGGETAMSAIGVIMSVSMLILMPIFGINQGAQPIIGYNYGAERYDRVKKALKLAILFATIITTIGFTTIMLFSKQLIQLFNSDDMELLRMGSTGLRIYMFMLPVVGFQIISSNYFQATGKPIFAMILSLSRQVLFLIPAVLLLPRLFNWGLTGVWLAGPTADFLAFLVTGILLIRELRQLDSMHQGTLASREI
ncbi:MAG TPA: MATE family efflux transporter [Bacillota bacterium]|nr:MATE family efflux transporter [Bacillota bacterium]